jgi:hypothetical protein
MRPDAPSCGRPGVYARRDNDDRPVGDSLSGAEARRVHEALSRAARREIASASNPFRPWLEYLAEWQLIERDEADLARLLAEAEYPTEDLHIFRDSSTLAFTVDVRV